MDIVPVAKALGVKHMRQLVWPHETYDRVWIIDFSPTDRKVTLFRDIPQCLLFGDSFLVASTSEHQGTFRFPQSYREISDTTAAGRAPATKWKCHIAAKVPGRFF